MKPLVYFCRWQGARLRLRGRDATAVWGELVYAGGDAERVRPFRFELATSRISLQDGDATQVLTLDEMGVAVDDDSA